MDSSFPPTPKSLIFLLREAAHPILGSWHYPLGCCCIASDSLQHQNVTQRTFGVGGELLFSIWLTDSSASTAVKDCRGVEGLLAVCYPCSSCAVRASFSNFTLRAHFRVQSWEFWWGHEVLRNARKPIWIFSHWKKDLIGKCISVNPTEKQRFPSQWGSFRYKRCLCLVNPVLTCNCLDYLYPPSIDLRLCYCQFMHFDMSCVSSLPIPQNPLAQELLYFCEALESTDEAQT